MNYRECQCCGNCSMFTPEYKGWGKCSLPLDGRVFELDTCDEWDAAE